MGVKLLKRFNNYFADYRLRILDPLKHNFFINEFNLCLSVHACLHENFKSRLVIFKR